MGRKKDSNFPLWRWKRLKGNANLEGFGFRSGEAETGSGGGGGGGAVVFGGGGGKAVGGGGVVDGFRTLNTGVDPNGKLDFSPFAFHFDRKGCKKKRVRCWKSDGRVWGREKVVFE